MSEGICGRQDKQAEELDRMVRAKLGLEEGFSDSWSSILEEIRDKIDPFRLEDVCVGCKWLDLDYCTSGLAKLAETRIGDE